MQNIQCNEARNAMSVAALSLVKLARNMHSLMRRLPLLAVLLLAANANATSQNLPICLRIDRSGTIPQAQEIIL
jgi:hypothetical protein